MGYSIKKIFKLVMLLTVSAVLMQSCKKDESKFKLGNQDFINQASSANMFEIAAGTLAIEKGSRVTVKTFGSDMVNEHQKVGVEISALASKKGLTVPSAMSSKEQAKYTALAAFSGTAFDKQYASMMVTSHQETISLFESAGSNTGVADADLRAFALAKLAALKEHLKEAQTLQTQVGN